MSCGAYRLQQRGVVQSRRAESGFSLLELMVVVTIIAILSAMVLPGYTQAGRERRIQEAAVSVLDLVRAVRSRAMYRGRAQLLVIQASGSALRLDGWEGSESSCQLSRFGSMAGVLDPMLRVAQLDLSAAEYTRDNLNAVIALPAGTSYLEVCFTPTGNAYFTQMPVSLPSEEWSNDALSTGSGGAYRIDVFQVLGGVENGVRRHVVIPLSGNPRMRS